MTKTALLTGAALALLSGAAGAADLPLRAAPPPVFAAVPVFTWTGFYAGLHTDYVFTERQRITTVGNTAFNQANVAALLRTPTTFAEVDGFANVGGGIGYNYQFTPGNGLVVGVQADVSWTAIEKNRGYLSPTVPVLVSTYKHSLNYLGTVVGRAGYAFDRFFVFGLGGFAFGDVTTGANFYNGGLALAYTGRTSDVQTGYAYGGGIEYAIPADSFLAKFNVLSLLGFQTAAVTLKAEYLHYDLGRRNLLVNNTGLAGSPGSYTSRFQTEGNLVRAGFSYKFSGL
ncbi:porin [Methylobacterium sp. 4-46]|uniref:outer membrane protein n=1 Tax=unclassified Methylobacterium TaxID=2615210 RepID=UPI000152C3AD|nr:MULTISPECIES: porin family protein [Methylobacterium]ACA16884.1 porin [Methylobacterium sp. 4-46]WFT82574.1 porin family protein [Methylobacterium nodulans]